MKKNVKIFTALLLTVCMVMSMATAAFADEPAAEGAVEKVTTICFNDADGPKVQAVVVEYNTELQAGSVDADTYDSYTYVKGLDPVYDIGSDNGGTIYGMEAVPASFAWANGTPGAVVNAYVSETPEIDPEGKGDESGKYVIVELNCDYMLAAACSSWRACVAGGVKQLKDIQTADGVIKASDEIYGNYEESYSWDINPHNSNHSVTLFMCMDDSLFTLDDIADYEIYITDHTDEVADAHHDADPEKVQYGDRDVDYKEATTTITGQIAGEGFKATNCYSEYDGEYHDVDLTYCLYVPEDYDPNGNYGLVLHIIDAGALGTDPATALTESQAAANYASDEVQGYAKEAGLDGLIVVMPYFTKDDQTVADNLTGNQFIPAVWQLMDYLTDTYAIDTNRIYGSGQSMGGMQVLYMASQRDNYFAGIWSIGSQWGSNYNKEEVYGAGWNAHAYFTFPDDSDFITNPDWKNWYYSISDDNILVTNMTGDASSTGYWQLTADIFETYGDDVDIPYVLIDPVETARDDQNATMDELVAEDNNTGIYWLAMTNGSHKATWLYAHAITSGYKWLVNQTKASEDERSKIEVLKTVTDGYSADTEKMPEVPSELASFAFNEDGSIVYCVNGKPYTKMTGFVEYDGHMFLVVDGVLAQDVNGLVQADDDTWYFVGAGMVQDYTGLAEYDGEWFYVVDGKLDTTFAGVVDYDGGKFLVAAGRILREVNGLNQDPITGIWYFYANGEVQVNYTGTATYDGATFQINHGMLA